MSSEKKMFIVKKSFNSVESKLFVKLNRGERKLEIYQRVANEKLNDHYHIREDFDNSPYDMYELEKSFDCILGSEDHPTPEGIFDVERKSRDMWFSRSYAGYDEVRFFGYLTIFENYLIHSDLYDKSVSAEAMRNDPTVHPVSKKDDHTRGCIRIAQENLDWMLDNVEEGTIVEL